MNKKFSHNPKPMDEPSPQDLHWLKEKLSQVPEVTASADLTQRVMSAVKHQQVRESRSHWLHRAAAAMVLIGLSVWGISTMNPRSAPAIATQIAPLPSETEDLGVPDALEWFCRNQEQDGSWNPARWGGNPRFEVALTALPLLALCSAEGERTPRQQEVADKAKAYLLSHCDENGRIGPAFQGSSYTQGIATLALLFCYQQQPDAELKQALQMAINVIVCQQQPYGSWTMADTAQSNAIATLWQREAIKLASDLGLGDVLPHIAQSSKWLNSQAYSLPERDDLALGKTRDFFSIYVATIQLRESGKSDNLDQLTSIRKNLLEKQIQQGEDSGSWPPSDRWSAVGGRLYSTAMASLALR
jgi:hypothetical protein